MYLHGTSTINQLGHLEIGGVDTVDIAGRFGTPVYVYDVALIRERARGFQRAFEQADVKYQVAYASKAFSCIAMVQLADEMGMSLDIVSSGELMTAKKAGFPMERVHFHGNNKSPEEIDLALDFGVGCFVLDNFYEVSLLQEKTLSKNQKVDALIRTTPGVEAHTHEYISTGQEDSKFGFDLASGQADKVIKMLKDDAYIQLRGVHSHIGSQIFDTNGFVLTVEKLFSQFTRWKEEYDFVPEILNAGGGFGIRYVEGDEPLPPEHYVADLVKAVKKEAAKADMAVPEIWIEPGRSITGDAGTTLYTVGSTKDIPGVRRYLSVDGGMTDNIRPALYQAEYEGVLANRANETAADTFAVAGKCCESGDMLMWKLPLPEVEHRDILAVFCTGAYGYSMANNYNRITRPPVVFVEDSQADLVVKGESLEDITKNDLPFRSKERV
ncbi:diaminopimelate decarboxylase [Alteribacillus persepolensis]|uniref:Diaminopimelate decarboxylase n=1 Tax=Alteribacillus persepolensis TaxID=568899 RepID=A0A1G7ZNA9_9BACI|nr:diaminopimelate decarboxylase [Alteribacillus persepolensis]SDH10154.1 diaminopimelate decarboxylase [Alteribacillus persepolensis]